MATTIKITNSFADKSTRTMEFGPYASVNRNDLKAAIKDLNSDTTAFAAYYLSDGGASFTAITGAQIITESTTEIDIED